METTQLELETVTPMFLHGHDNTIVELRPSPFKALFRYWWRTVQDRDANSLWEHEAELFGSTDDKAPFSIRIPGKKDLGNPIKYSPVPHKNTFRTDAYDVGKPFNLRLITKNTLDASRYKQIAKLGFLLGGVGNRSRRGFGSVHETKWNFPDVRSLRKDILETLNAVSEPHRFQMNKSFNIKDRSVTIIEPNAAIRTKWSAHKPEFPVIRRIFFGKQPTRNFGSLLKKIGRETSVAKRNNRDYTLGDGDPRMASPVVIRIQMIGSQYLLIATQLWSLYPENRNPHNFENKQLNFIYAIIK